MEAVEETVVTVGELPEGQEMETMELIEQKPDLETVVVNTSEPTIGDILVEAEEKALRGEEEDDKENDGKPRSNWHRYNAKRRYQPSWEEHFPWVCRAKPGAEYAFCKVCKKTLLPKISVLHSHDKGVKHLKRYNALIMEGGAMPGVGEVLDPTTGMIQSGPVEVGDNEELAAGMAAEVGSQNTVPMGFKQEIIEDPNDPKV